MSNEQRKYTDEEIQQLMEDVEKLQPYVDTILRDAEMSKSWSNVRKQLKLFMLSFVAILTAIITFLDQIKSVLKNWLT